MKSPRIEPCLRSVIPDLENGYGVIWFAKAGIQNGENPDYNCKVYSGGPGDSIELRDKDNNRVATLSYENKPDCCMYETGCVDCICQPYNTEVGHSFQLQGSLGNFKWSSRSIPHTRGKINTNQTFTA